jgi:hypothetical protein
MLAAVELAHTVMQNKNFQFLLKGVLIDDELTVRPGTPLSMEINLDSNSKDIYGLMVSNMEVTDTQQQEEVLILNG